MHVHLFHSFSVSSILTVVPVNGSFALTSNIHKKIYLYYTFSIWAFEAYFMWKIYNCMQNVSSLHLDGWGDLNKCQEIKLPDEGYKVYAKKCGVHFPSLSFPQVVWEEGRPVAALGWGLIFWDVCNCTLIPEWKGDFIVRCQSGRVYS